MKQNRGNIFAAALLITLIAVILIPTIASAETTDLYTVQVKGSYDTASAREMLSNINDLRANDAWYWNSSDTEKVNLTDLTPLVYDYELERAAMQRAAELAVYYSHTRPNGKTPFTAYSSAVSGGSTGENIAYGDEYFDSDSIFTMWAEADEPYSGQGHRRNMLSSRFRSVGIGCFRCEGKVFWTQEFSSVVSGAAANPLTSPVSVELLRDRVDSVSLGRNSFNMSLGASISLDEIALYLDDAYKPWISVPCQLTADNLSVANTAVAKVTNTALVAQGIGDTTLTATVSGLTVTVPVVVGENTPLTLNNPIEVTIPAGEEVIFGFVPTETASYAFSSGGSYDTIAYLYDSNNNLLASDDDSGNSYNFTLLSELTAGKQYFYGICLYGDEDSGTVTVNLTKATDFGYKLLSDGSISITNCFLSGDVVIPEQIDGYTVSNLAEELFYGKDDITSVTIPATVTYFGSNKSSNEWDYVFSYCYDLENIFVDSRNPSFQSVDGVLFSKDGKVLINYPCAHPGVVYHVQAELLCCTSFASCSDLRFLFLDNPRTTWYTYTFYNTTGLTTFYEPGGNSSQKAEVEIAAGREFGSDIKYCKLKCTDEIQHLPAAVKEIQSEAYQGIAVKYLMIPDSCRVIGSGAFTGSGLEYVSIPKSATVPSNAFDSTVVVEKR